MLRRRPLAGRGTDGARPDRRAVSRCRYLGVAPDTVNHILVWGLFGIGFDLLFGYTGLLSFGQSAFYGTGGFIAAYLLTNNLIVERAAGAGRRHDRRGDRRRRWSALLALRRTGIYFAMITVAIAEMFFFLENSPLSAWTGGENGLPGVPTPSFDCRLFPLSGRQRTGRCMASSPSVTSSASSSRCASCARRSAPS